MWSSDSDRDEPAAASTPTTATSSLPSSPSSSPAPPRAPPTPPPRRRRQRARRRRAKNAAGAEEEPAEPEAEEVWGRLQREASWPRRASRPVVVADEAGGGSPSSGAAGGEGGGGVGRARSLTDDDLEELKGCVDLGFGFSYHEIPELCGTLPALELCYSMSQRFLDDHHHLATPDDAPPPLAPPSPAPPAATNWKISSPGDSPDEVKARLKYWAQAVACTVRLCS
ncbi:hypothetical protein ACP4OV_013222 [Aristida adscensionis]